MVPEAQLVQLFRLKYDYHNAKALIKAQAMGTDCGAILSQRGTVPPQKLHAAFYEEDYRDIPPVLAQAMVDAAAILARTANPQAADFALDRAYFAQMLALCDGLSDGGFAKGYVQLQIDGANLRAAVRTRRMAKDADFLKNALVSGGTIGTDRVLAAFESGEALTALYANTWLSDAASAGAAAMSGGALTAFELLCDNALMDYIRAAKLRSFGAAHVSAYLAAMENETTAARMILTGRLAGLQPAVIRERLRETYA
ncbi:MAG: V-type ATPase subunit [Oscillospiraceae bacterium]